MMTVTLRAGLIVASAITFIFMMRKIRQEKVQIEAALFWVITALMLVVFSIYPPLADFFARLAGVYSTPNFIFLLVIFLLIIKIFFMSVHISQLETKMKELVQRMALDEKKEEEEHEPVRK